MPSTTIRLEAEWVKRIAALKLKDESFSGYVRRLIEKEYLARKHHEAARSYLQFLRENPRESIAMDEWESAPSSRRR